ncbi:cilia- and flagella-associated protein HOATZ [Myripristis murdjan]|uniref:cilia- and flagella-associated protein HOATZ n=1 Tax=Myripristis murdjan TaxID=586833 RepID=UPI0011763857|nr:UPF0722 protein C11orf88 homolog [Myripristis murdjan]XP_029914488.1 UPF0722 protein C11orf88 homolog [Myripristis murdjan]
MAQQQPEPSAEQEWADNLMVFEGSSPVDVSHAKQLWNSLSLQPLLESRLVSADIRQKLPVARPRRDTDAGPRSSSPGPSSVFPLLQRREERQRYLAMAKQRKEILALLRRQREQRIQRELVSLPCKPKMRDDRGKQVKRHDTPSEQALDKEMVEQLH